MLSPRFKDSWKRILFRGDRKSQVQEITELQEVVAKAQKDAFDYLYGESFYPTRLPLFSLVSVGSLTYSLRYSGGQFYLNGSFIDVAPGTLQISTSAVSRIGLRVNYITEDRESYQDPITGGEFSGDKGASRYVLSAQVVVNQDSYPIALAFPKAAAADGPAILLYQNSEFVSQVETIAVDKVRDLIRTYLQDSSSNFIASGLNVKVDSLQRVVVSPGVAYIQGVRLDIRAPLYSAELSQGGFISVELSSTGDLVLSQNSTRTLSSRLSLAVLTFEQDEWRVTESSERGISNNQILSLIESNERLAEDMGDFLLQKQRLDLEQTNINPLNGIFVDSFSNLTNSDTGSPIYSASLSPDQHLVKAGVTVTSVDFSNVTEVQPNQAAVVSRRGNPFYITSSLINRSLVSQPRTTNTLTLNRSSISNPSITVSPNRAQPSTNQRFRVTAFFNNRPLSRYDLLVRRVVVNGSGFVPLEDGLRVSFGSVQISELELLNLTLAGSLPGTIRAKADGTISFAFNVPANLPLSTYVVTVGNRTLATGLYTTDGYAGGQVATNVSGPRGGTIAQSFSLSSGAVLTGCRLKFRTLPDISTDLRLGTVSLVRLVNNLPSQEVLAFGEILLSQLVRQTSVNGSIWSEFNFDKPASVSAGSYALVINSSLSGAEVFIASRGMRDLINGQVVGVDPLAAGSLYTLQGNRWFANNSADLSFEVIQGIPAASSSVEFTVSNPNEPFHLFEAAVPYTTPPGTTVEVQFLENGFWKNAAGIQALEDGVNFLRMRLQLTSSSQATPVIESENINFRLFSNLSSSSWVSRTVDTNKYSSIELQLEEFQPTSANIRVYFSSNQGQNWEELTEVPQQEEVIDGLIPLVQRTYQKLNLTKLVPYTDLNGDSISIERTWLTIRIDIITGSRRTPSPYIKNLVVVVR